MPSSLLSHKLQVLGCFVVTIPTSSGHESQRLFKNSFARQHTLLVSADTVNLDIEVFNSFNPLEDVSPSSEDTPRTRRTRSGAVTKGNQPPLSTAKLQRKGPKIDFRVIARPTGLLAELESTPSEYISSYSELPLARFSFQIGQGTSTFEIGCKVATSSDEEEVYRLFVTRVGSNE